MTETLQRKRKFGTYRHLLHLEIELCEKVKDEFRSPLHTSHCMHEMDTECPSSVASAHQSLQQLKQSSRMEMILHKSPQASRGTKERRCSSKNAFKSKLLELPIPSNAACRMQAISNNINPSSISMHPNKIIQYPTLQSLF
jgi:hypothetical protein